MKGNPLFQFTLLVMAVTALVFLFTTTIHEANVNDVYSGQKYIIIGTSAVNPLRDSLQVEALKLQIENQLKIKQTWNRTK